MVFEMKCAVICCEKLHSAVIGVDALQYAVIERNALLTASPSIAPAMLPEAARASRAGPFWPLRALAPSRLSSGFF